MKANTSSMRWWTWVGALAICLGWPMATFGAGVITFSATGTQLLPNTANQKVNILVSDTLADQYTALIFYLQIADGGLNNGVDTTQTGPLISNMVAGAGGALLVPSGNGFGSIVSKLFDATNNPTITESQIWQYSGHTANQGSNFRTLPTTPTLLLTVSVDTTGNFAPGPWSMTVQGTFTGSQTVFQKSGGTVGSFATTDFFPPVTLSTPEPMSLGLLGIIIPGILLRRRQVAVV